jgi:hypothetical protein
MATISRDETVHPLIQVQKHSIENWSSLIVRGASQCLPELSNKLGWHEIQWSIDVWFLWKCGGINHLKTLLKRSCAQIRLETLWGNANESMGGKVPDEFLQLGKGNKEGVDVLLSVPYSGFEVGFRVRSLKEKARLVATDSEGAEDFQRVACVDDFGESREDGF